MPEATISGAVGVGVGVGVGVILAVGVWVVVGVEEAVRVGTNVLVTKMRTFTIRGSDAVSDPFEQAPSRIIKIKKAIRRIRILSLLPYR